jgi:hypothetical protein
MPAPLVAAGAIEVGKTVAGLFQTIISRVWPDPADAARATQAMAELEQAGEFKRLDFALQEMQMQVDVNKIEAANPSVFVSGWRPAVGWVCTIALFWHFIGRPFAAWILLLNDIQTEIPVVEMMDLWVILGGLLGIGGMRSYERAHGVARLK